MRGELTTYPVATEGVTHSKDVPTTSYFVPSKPPISTEPSSVEPESSTRSEEKPTTGYFPKTESSVPFRETTLPVERIGTTYPETTGTEAITGITFGTTEAVTAEYSTPTRESKTTASPSIVETETTTPAGRNLTTLSEFSMFTSETTSTAPFDSTTGFPYIHTTYPAEVITSRKPSTTVEYTTHTPSLESTTFPENISQAFIDEYTTTPSTGQQVTTRRTYDLQEEPLVTAGPANFSTETPGFTGDGMTTPNITAILVQTTEGLSSLNVTSTSPPAIQEPDLFTREPTEETESTVTSSVESTESRSIELTDVELNFTLGPVMTLTTPIPLNVSLICLLDSDCHDSETCVQNYCVNPCYYYSPCPTINTCRALNHTAVCFCNATADLSTPDCYTVAGLLQFFVYSLFHSAPTYGGA
ncbi:unnamed protein product [Hermetia illucens]|uniref:Uncharacterized protein n=1 Tax=Hermetia illucens TaxID=343691 RepID=A0A7R8YLB1_HERIL|nr:unnamed protein product [Hermetia illucens]